MSVRKWKACRFSEECPIFWIFRIFLFSFLSRVLQISHYHWLCQHYRMSHFPCWRHFLSVSEVVFVPASRCWLLSRGHFQLHPSTPSPHMPPKATPKYPRACAECVFVWLLLLSYPYRPCQYLPIALSVRTPRIPQVHSDLSWITICLLVGSIPFGYRYYREVLEYRSAGVPE